MKNNHFQILSFFILLLSSCNLFDEDDCIPADFVGTYTIDETTVDEDCNSKFEETINIQAAGSNAVSIDGGVELSINGCSAFNEISGPLTGLAAGDKVTVDGTTLRFQKNTCFATYIRD